MSLDGSLITDPEISERQNHKYLGILGMLWVTFLILNLFTALKTFEIGGFVFAVVILTYPLVYIFADIFTEIYGYRVTRRIVWTGFLCMAISSVIAYIYTIIPSPNFADNEAYNLIFRSSPIVAFFVILAFFCGELTNSYIVAKLKVLTGGKLINLRLVLSTLFGQLVDNSIAITGIFLFAGWFTSEQVIPLIISTILFCTAWEILALPITRKVIRILKRREGLDTYDVGTNFNPFAMRR